MMLPGELTQIGGAMGKNLLIIALLGFLVGVLNAPAYACGSGDDCTDGGDQPVKDCTDSSCE